MSHIPTMADQKFFLMSLLGSLEMDFTQMVFMKLCRLYRKQVLRGVWVDSLKGHCLLRPAHCTQRAWEGKKLQGTGKRTPEDKRFQNVKVYYAQKTLIKRTGFSFKTVSAVISPFSSAHLWRTKKQHNKGRGEEEWVGEREGNHVGGHHPHSHNELTSHHCGLLTLSGAQGPMEKI